MTACGLTYGHLMSSTTYLPTSLVFVSKLCHSYYTHYSKLKTSRTHLSEHSCNDTLDLTGQGYAPTASIYVSVNDFIQYDCDGTKRMDDSANGESSFTVQCLPDFTYNFSYPIVDCVQMVTCNVSNLPTMGPGMVNEPLDSNGNAIFPEAELDYVVWVLKPLSVLSYNILPIMLGFRYSCDTYGYSLFDISLNQDIGFLDNDCQWSRQWQFTNLSNFECRSEMNSAYYIFKHTITSHYVFKESDATLLKIFQSWTTKNCIWIRPWLAWLTTLTTQLTLM